MKKLLAIFMVLFWFLGYSFALEDGPDSFLIEVNPPIFQPNQPVDVTITAMKNGVVYPSFTGDVWLSISGLNFSEYVVPSKGWYQFVPEDLWKKTFSKGLEIKKIGEFTLRAENVENTIYGTTVLNVSSTTSSPEDVKTILISSPLNSAIETQSNVLLLAQAPSLPNSLAQIYLNGFLADEVSVDQQWNINYTLSGLKEWKNTLLISIKSFADQELGKSEQIEFTYAPMQTNLFKKITIVPNTGLMLGDLVTFDVEADSFVTSAKLILDNGQAPLPLDNLSDGKFSKSTTMVSTGTISLSLELIANNQTQTFTGVGTLLVQDIPMITNVMMRLDAQNQNNLLINRSMVGASVDAFRVKYWLTEESLEQSVDVEKPEIIFQNINPAREYYFQIFPLFWTGSWSGEEQHWAATEIYVYSPKITTATGEVISSSGVVVDLGTLKSSCVIQGIRVVTQKIGNKHYLVWKEVPWATSYTVYMADTPTGSKKALLTTKETRFEYPFDYSSEEDIYAYFWVEASCDDGQTVELTSSQKVQVGPAEDILLLICVSLLIYAGIRLYRYAE